MKAYESINNKLSEFFKINFSNLKYDVIKELECAQKINKVLDRYKYSTTDNRNIGDFSNIVIPKYLSLPYLNYINEFSNLYGLNAIKTSGKTENEIMHEIIFPSFGRG